MSMLLMVEALSLLVSLGQISLDQLWSSKFRQLLKQWNELLIRDGQRGESEGLLFPFVLLSSLLSELIVRGL